jgi:hypothetical protein
MFAQDTDVLVHDQMFLHHPMFFVIVFLFIDKEIVGQHIVADHLVMEVR